MKRSNSVGNLDIKLKMLEQQLKSCLENFHEPIAFMTSVDSMIQSLRNYTFAIQANKSEIPNFDEWYGVWRDRMKNDDYLRWLHSIRTDVVHKDILTTESHAVLTLHPDHLLTLQTIHFDIMATTKEMIEDGINKANERKELKHSTGIIERYYLCNVNGNLAETIHILVAAYDFMETLHQDLVRYMRQGKIHHGDLPQLTEFEFQSPPELTVVFKLRDGKVLREGVTRIKRDDSAEAMKVAKKRYGKFTLVHNLKSKSYKERTRAYFEIAERIFIKDGYHIPMIYYHNKKGWQMMSMVYTDRAEKILFWKKFGDKVKAEGIDKVIFTSESWIYGDLKKGIQHITEGKEIKTLRNKKEVLETYYIDKKGRFFVRSALILRTPEGISLGNVSEREADFKTMPLFASIYHAWGLIELD